MLSNPSQQTAPNPADPVYMHYLNEIRMYANNDVYLLQEYTRITNTANPHADESWKLPIVTAYMNAHEGILQ